MGNEACFYGPATSPIPRAGAQRPPIFLGTPAWAHTVWETATKVCMVIKLDDETIIEGLRERTEYVPHLWNWENHLQSQWRGRIYRDVWFFHPRSSCTRHLMLFSERLPIYASSCKTISGEITEQLDTFCRVTGFTSDFRPPQTSGDRPRLYASGMTISGERTEQHVVIDFGEQAAVD